MLVLNFPSYVTSGFANEHSQRGIIEGKLLTSAYFIVLPITGNHVKFNRLLLGVCYSYFVPVWCVKQQYYCGVIFGSTDIYSFGSLLVMITTKCMCKLEVS